MSTIIKVNFKMQSGKTYKEEVDTNKTIDRMIADFLEKRKLIHEMNKYSFMVNAAPLDKKEVLKKKVKHFNKIKPDCTIQVRQIDSIDGGFN
jgi:hypothetical protein